MDMHHPMKFLASVATVFCLLTNTSFAADPVKINIYVDGTLKHEVELNGPNANCRFSLNDAPDTELELRLIAPEPVIIDFKETQVGEKATPSLKRIRLIGKGDSYPVSQRAAEAHFHRPYVLVRPE